MRHRLFDCIVIGLGPAGAIAAYTLARAGWSVLALDKSVHPRPKICGGCLSRKVDAILPFSVSSVIEHPVNGVVFTFKGQGGIKHALDEPFAYMVRREKFDNFLVQKAIEAGAIVRQGEWAVSLTKAESGIFVETKMGCYRGKVVVGADGVQGIVARELGPDYAHSSCLALTTEIAINSVSPGNCIWIDIGWVDLGYGWIFPRHPSCSVGIAGSGSKGLGLKKAFASLFTSHWLLAEQKATTINGYRIPLSTSTNRQKKIISDRVALIGDAAGLADPLTGEGIYYALWSGLSLANCLIEHGKDLSSGLKDYDRRIRLEFHPQFAVAEQVARLLFSHPWASFHLAEKCRDLVGLLVEVVMGKECFPNLLSLLKRKLGLKDRMAR